MQGIEYKIMRIRARKTLREVSKEIGVSIGLLSMLENDKHTPKEATMTKIDNYWKER